MPSESKMNDIRDMRDLMINVVNDPKIEDEVVNWAYNADFGDTYARHGIQIKCVHDEVRKVNARLTDIVNSINIARNNRKAWNGTIYFDGVWTVDLEWNPNGQHKFWMTREDKQGHFNRSIITVLDSGFSCDFKPIGQVQKKVLSTYKALKKANLIR
jgi:serine protease inhibitor